jgi:hypothetical protein
MSGFVAGDIPGDPAISRAGVRPVCAGPDLEAAKPRCATVTCRPGVPTREPRSRSSGELWLCGQVPARGKTGAIRHRTSPERTPALRLLGGDRGVSQVNRCRALMSELVRPRTRSAYNLESMSRPEHQTIVAIPITANATGVANDVGIQMATLMWSRWAGIALAHLQAARQALARLQAEPDSSKWAPEDLNTDVEASMQAIAASAFAVEALWKRLQQVLDAAGAEPNLSGSRGDAGKALRIIEASTAHPPARLKKDLEWLYGERTSLVHFKDERSRPTRPHPVLPTNVAYEHARFSATSAQRAAEILMCCLRACITNAASATQGWADESKTALELLDHEASALGL